VVVIEGDFTQGLFGVGVGRGREYIFVAGQMKNYF